MNSHGGKRVSGARRVVLAAALIGATALVAAPSGATPMRTPPNSSAPARAARPPRTTEPVSVAPASKPTAKPVANPAAKPAAKPYALGTYAVTLSPSLAPGTIELQLRNYRGDNYGELQSRKLLRTQGSSTRGAPENASLLVDLKRATAPTKARAGKEYRRCTFAVDCDEPSVKAVYAELLQRTAPGKKGKPSAGQIREFVREYITKKSLAYGLTPASTPATTREGDCTEHALLFVALARLAGYPARAVFGLVLVGVSGGAEPAAYGHAWGEVHDGKRWIRHDPALQLLPASGASDVQSVNVARSENIATPCLAYVPLSLYDQDGPGARARSFGLNLIHVEEIRARDVTLGGQCGAARKGE